MSSSTKTLVSMSTNMDIDMSYNKITCSHCKHEYHDKRFHFDNFDLCSKKCLLIQRSEYVAMQQKKEEEEAKNKVVTYGKMDAGGVY